MKFNPAENDLENNYFYRRVSENGRFYICVWPVLFGFRVRAGLVANIYSCAVDACAGATPEGLTTLYNLYLLALDKCQTDGDVLNLFRCLPSSKKRPFMYDDDFFNRLTIAAGVYGDRDLFEELIEQRFRQGDLIKMRLITSR